jgi:hypothetical protein
MVTAFFPCATPSRGSEDFTIAAEPWHLRAVRGSSSHGLHLLLLAHFRHWINAADPPEDRGQIHQDARGRGAGIA